MVLPVLPNHMMKLRDPQHGGSCRALPGSRPDGENTGMMRCEPTCFIVTGLSHFYFISKEFEKGIYFVNLTWESEGVGHYRKNSTTK